MKSARSPLGQANSDSRLHAFWAQMSNQHTVTSTRTIPPTNHSFRNALWPDDFLARWADLERRRRRLRVRWDLALMPRDRA